jgi:hypothetical protein
MKPRIPCSRSTDADRLIVHDDASVRRFLFEDDHEFSRMIGTFLAFKSTSQKFSENAGYATTVGAFIILLGLLAEIGGWQGLNLNSNRNVAGPSADGSGEQAKPQAESWFAQWSDYQSGLGPLDSWLVDDQNYSVATVLDLEGETSGISDAMSRSAIVLAQTSSTTSAISQLLQVSSFGGGGGGGGLQVASPAEPAIAEVPEVGNSAMLLTLGVALMFIGRICSNARSNNPLG